jgi:3-dehydroquinate dehydratase/shikimate dehydrogenase
MSDALEQVSSSAPYADLVEFRLDLIREPALGTLLLSTRKPVIATCRPTWEGGRFRGREEDRLRVLWAASLLGATYVDLELRANRSALGPFLDRRRETKLILSYHAPVGSRIKEANIYRNMRAVGADVVKFAFYVQDAHHNATAFDFLLRAKKDGQHAVAIAMGEAGEPSRVLYRVFGGWATYAAAAKGNEAAPGQITAKVLKEVYRADSLNGSTKIFGVIGNPIAQSKGVLVHNPLFARAGRNAVYCRFLVSDLPLFMKRIGPRLAGFSVTLPHKEHVIRFLDRVDPTAGAIGAVNTVIRRGGAFWGTNTDAPGALDAIERTGVVRGKTMLILGAGGAARGIAYEAKRRGADVLIANRTVTKARAIARRFGLTQVPVRALARTSYDIFVNATSVGMTPHANATPFAARFLRNKIVFDAVYNPPMTRLLREALRVRARVIQGTEMYINQGARQFRLYAGIDPDKRIIRRLILGDH